MIQLIYAQKGNGKTKRLLGLVSEEFKNTEGSIVFIDDDTKYLREVPTGVRFVDISEYGIKTADGLFGFICGMYAQNYDIKAFYIDALLKICGKSIEDLDSFFSLINDFCADKDIKFVMSVSADAAEAPDYLKAYII